METNILTQASSNVELVRRGYEAFNKADIKTLNEIFHDDFTWQTPGKSPIAGIYSGKNNVFSQFGRYGGETKGTFTANLKNIAVCQDGTVVGIHHNSGERNGKRLDVDCCLVFEFKDGQMISGKEHFLELDKWDAFWS